MHKNSTTRCKQVVLFVIYKLLSMNYLTNSKISLYILFMRLKKKSFVLLFTNRQCMYTLLN